MTARPHTAPGWISVEDLIQRYVLGDRHSAYPVADRDGSIVGLVTLTQLRNVAPSKRTTASVGDIASAAEQCADRGTAGTAERGLERMAPVGPRSRALVIDPGGVVGIVTPSDVARLIDVSRLAQPGPALTAPGHTSEMSPKTSCPRFPSGAPV